MKSKNKVVNIVGLALMLSMPATAHICLFGPVTQRGGLPGPLTPGTHACFKSAGPCGGMAAEEPSAVLPGGTSVPLLMQQNLNHYSVGSPGILDWAVSLSADPQSDAEFEVLGSIQDYDAYHEWTQTNLTLKIVLPNVDCPHAVLRVRYISNKPTEPLSFHQCADITIASTPDPVPARGTALPRLSTPATTISATRPATPEVSVSRGRRPSPPPPGPVASVGAVFALVDRSDSDDLAAGTGSPYAELGVVDLLSGETTSVVAQFAGHPVDASAPAYTADVVAAVDAERGVLYYLQNIASVGEASAVNVVTVVAVTLGTAASGTAAATPTTKTATTTNAENANGTTVVTTSLTAPCPLSALHFDASHGRLLGVGLRLFNGSNHAVVAVELDLASGEVLVVASSADHGQIPK